MKSIIAFCALALALTFAASSEAQGHFQGRGRGPHGNWHGPRGNNVWVGPQQNWHGRGNWHGHRRPYYPPRPILLPPPIIQPPIVQPPVVLPPPIEQQILIAPNQCPGNYYFDGYNCQPPQIQCIQAPCQQPQYVPEQTFFCAPDYCNQAPALLPYPGLQAQPLPGGYGIQAECRIVRIRSTGQFVVLQNSAQELYPRTNNYQQAVQILQQYRMQNVCR